MKVRRYHYVTEYEVDVPSVDSSTKELRWVPDQETAAKPISSLSLTARPRNAISRLGIKTVGQLCSHSRAELLGAKNFGEGSLRAIETALEKLGLQLRHHERNTANWLLVKNDVITAKSLFTQLAKLPPSYRRVLISLWGLTDSGAGKQLSIEKICQVTGLTRHRVADTRKRALRMMAQLYAQQYSPRG